MTTFMSCSMRMIVMPSSRIRRMRPMRAAVSCGFMPAAGSSRKSSVGSVASARAISRRRCEP